MPIHLLTFRYPCHLLVLIWLLSLVVVVVVVVVVVALYAELPAPPPFPRSPCTHYRACNLSARLLHRLCAIVRLTTNILLLLLLLLLIIIIIIIIIMIRVRAAVFNIQGPWGVL